MLNLNNSASKKTDEKLLGHSSSNRKMATSNQVKKKKPKTKKRKRLIIRNLSFKAEEDDLKEVFSKFGKVLDVKIPLKADGKKRGFAFVEFEDTKSIIQAMKSMNYKEILGRKIAIDYAIDKSSYQLKVQSIKQEKKNEPKIKEENMEPDVKPKPEEDLDASEDEEEDEEEKRLNAFLKEFDSGADALTNPHVEDNYVKSSSDESSSEDFEDEDNEYEEKVKIKQEPEESSSPAKQKTKKRDSKDVSEGKTVFLRNVAFTTNEESLEEAMEEYGDCEYCLLCVDPLTNHPKGTAFVKFKEKTSAEKLIHASYIEPGIVVDGRKLICTNAISREDASHFGKAVKQKSDRRNLYLLRVGEFAHDSEEIKNMSKGDAGKRAQLERLKRQKLKNVNFFISDKRLLVHNLPPTFTDSKLQEIFKKAAGHGAVITEVKVMKEFKKTDAQGMPLSKGFGFVSFNKHEYALKALNELNNNPSVFTSQRRPIVEFSVENKVALLAKEKRKEKMQLQKKKRTEEKNERQENESSKNDNKGQKKTSNKRNKRKKQQMPAQNIKKRKQNFNQDSKALEEVNRPEKHKKNKNQKRKGKKSPGGYKQNGLSDLKQEYLNKLSNKIEF
ncbi:RNA-binding protein 28 [Trichonephila inaurata madagascariensis]|uniref:RNA-binding protein 28 n=1 Tax=Trichonephila inaurata madagascariensis TaxID=2747483 RepID=A0A8X6MB23_9ARAC|nr:RNA-binding protein 28 [Trichonephila inaurata madagascariensis]